ncbi:MAG: hypothetical protein HY553_09990 [Elusimicrobia bacterium]|nr:hypothetical protein [Elusimicrobiota bacterium]
MLACLAFFLLGTLSSHAAERKPYGPKYFGEGQADREKPQAQPLPPAPEREDYSANYGRDPRVTPREPQTRPAAALAGGKRDAAPAVQTQASKTVAATALAGAGGSASEPSSSPAAFAPGERPRDSVHSAPASAPERVAPPANPSTPPWAARAGGSGPARTPPPPSQLFDAQPQRPPLEEPKAQPRPWQREPPANAPEPRAAPPGGPSLVSMSAPAQPAAPAPVFVSMELDLSNDPGNYRDAVKSLSKNAGFSLDPRFAPVYRDSRRDRVSVWGWVPAAQVREAVSAPGVVRLEAAPQAQSAPAGGEPEAQWRLLLRLPPAEEGSPDPAADFAGTLMRLSEQGFVWKRSEPRNSAGLVAVLGTMPQRSLKRVLADPAVVRVEPFRQAPAPQPAPLQASAGPSWAWLRAAAGSPMFLLLIALVPLIARFLREATGPGP